MKQVLIAAAGLALLSGAATAQTPPRPYGDESNSGDRYRTEDRDWRQDRGPRGWERMGGDRDGRHEGGGKGASFYLRNGTASLGVRCGSNEPMQACVDAAIKLMDRARAVTPPPNAPTPQ